MEYLSRHSKKIVSLMIMVMTLTIGVCSFSFESKASTSNDFSFNVSYPQPTCDKYSGYFSLVYKVSSDNLYHLETYYWNLIPIMDEASTNDYSIDMSVGFDSSGNLRFRGSVLGSATYLATFSIYTDYDTLWLLKSGVYSNIGDNLEVSFDCNSRSIVGVLYGGNCVYDGSITGLRIPNIQWSDSISASNLDSYLSAYQYILQNVEGNTQEISEKLSSIENTVEQLLNEQKDSNSWLEKIWNSIQEFINPSDEDKTESEEFKSETEDKSNQINDLNQQNKTDKIDIDSTSSEIETNIDTDAIGTYGTVLSVFTSNANILQYILIVLAVALIAYVLFGKR